MRHAAAAVFAFALAACVPAPVPNDPPLGPSLVIDVWNRSDRQLEVGYEFEAGGSSGSGAGVIEPCQRGTMPGGQIGGEYAVLVGGKRVLEDTVPPAPEGAFLVINVSVGPDGEVEVFPRGFVRVPPVDSAAIPGCN